MMTYQFDQLDSTYSGRGTLEVYALGVVDYESLLALQERLSYELSGRRDRMGILLLCEHPPVVTVGREGGHRGFRVPLEEFTSRLMDVHWVSRGSGNLVHVPGQLAIYPILPLERIGMSVTSYRDGLLSSMQRVCEEQRVPVRVDSEVHGVVARTGLVGQVGIAIKNGTTQFGAYLDVQPNLDQVRLCQPKRNSLRQSSLAADRMKHIAMGAVRESIVRHLAEQLSYDQLHWYTGHPLLKRTKKKVHVHA